MFPYWVLFGYFAAGAFLHGDSDRKHGISPFLVAGIVLIALMIGLRHEVGGDWFGYQRIFAFAGIAELQRVLALGDPGYQILNWVAQKVGAGIWLVNLICALIFSAGLLAFARIQPNPWLAVLVAVPYLVIVVAMGYTRQSVAIGIILAGLANMERGGSVARFALYVLAAALFHKTAVVVLPLIILSAERNRFATVMLGLAVTFLFYQFFLSSETDRLVRNYIGAEYASQGAGIRVAMNILPAALFLLQQRRFGFAERERKIWRNFSLAAFAFLILLFVLPSSTAVDRLALYATPLQIAVLSRVPIAYRSRGLGTFLVVLYSFAVQFVWFNYAANADTWIPYRIVPMGN